MSTSTIRSSLFQNAAVLLVLLLLSYPLFYFSYKYTLPDMGGADYFHYLHLYESWDVANTEAPFNMRIIGSYGTYLFNKVGLHYNTETVFAAAHPELSQQTFFNALLFNYLCVLVSAFVIYRTARTSLDNALLAFIGSLVFLLGFGTVFFLLKPANDACGVLLIAIGYHYYLRKSVWVYPILLLCVFQREYALMVFGMLAAVNYFFERHRYFIWVLLASIVSFGLYYILRKTIFYSPLHDGQTKPGFFLQSLLHPEVEWGPFIKQLALSCNLLWLYAAVVVYKMWKGMTCSKLFMAIVSVLFVQVIFMSIAAGFGNNTGRIFYFIAPMVVYFLLMESKSIVISSVQN
jgi:hypothetical protein